MTKIFSCSLQGSARDNNEDAFMYEPNDATADQQPQCLLGVVADGLGGHASGEIASRLAVDSFRSSFTASQEQFDIAKAVAEAHQAICALAARQPEHAGMGTTVAGALLRGTQAQVFNAGDSRAYQLTGDNIQQLSTDDRSRTGRLTQCLGVSDTPVPAAHTVTVQLRCGDMIVLVSDGVSDVLSAAQIAKTAAAGGDIAQQLCKSAKQAGSGDDTTAVVLVV